MCWRLAQVVSLTGRSQRPLCHFDLPACDYLERRPAGLPDISSQVGPLDSSLRVLEFQSLGIRVKNTARFAVVNPTNASYEFAWEVRLCWMAAPGGRLAAALALP